MVAALPESHRVASSEATCRPWSLYRLRNDGADLKNKLGRRLGKPSRADGVVTRLLVTCGRVGLMRICARVAYIAAFSVADELSLLFSNRRARRWPPARPLG
jgi:hypothetical protein